MTYLEQLYAGIEYIAKRHKDVKGINIKLYKYDPGDWKEFGVSTCEHWLIECDKPNIEVILDFESLCYDLHLPKPDACSFDDRTGFMIINRNPQDWNVNYRDNKCVLGEYCFPIPYWRCSDKFFKERYQHFDEVISRLSKNKKS